jgi:hypothetical protein
MKPISPFKTNEKTMTEFAILLGKMEVTDFLGLAKILNVYVFDNEQKDEKGHPVPREGDKIIEDCIIAFDKCNRKYRKEILKIMRKAVKK